MKLGGIEAGGTKMVCAIGDEQGNIFDRAVFPTETPEITVPKMIEYFQDKGIEALGIGCFGPVDLNRKSATYGYITSTPKLAWRFYDFAGAFREALQIPVGFDTDVNGAVLGEVRFGAAKGCENALYITIGTGVGVGAYIYTVLLWSTAIVASLPSGHWCWIIRRIGKRVWWMMSICSARACWSAP